MRSKNKRTWTAEKGGAGNFKHLSETKKEKSRNKRANAQEEKGKSWQGHVNTGPLSTKLRAKSERTKNEQGKQKHTNETKNTET